MKKASLCLLILAAAIQTFADSSITTLKDNLAGTWEWVETSGGYSGDIYTPRSEHYSLTLVFSKNVPQPESDSIGYRVYRNDTLILSGITTVTLSNMPAFGPGNLIQGTATENSDTLRFDMFVSDGYSSIFVKSKTSRKVVRGTVCDSATGAPIGNVKVFITQSRGEWPDTILDSTITASNGSYLFTNSSLNGTGLNIYTIATQHYFQSMPLDPTGIDDTITRNIILRRIPTMVSTSPDSRALPDITVKTAESRLYLSGIKTDAIVDIYDLNGRLFFRTVVPAGTSGVRMPGRVAAGRYHMTIKTNGHPIGGKALFR